MARSATPPRSSPTRRAKPPTPAPGAKSAAKTVARATKPSPARATKTVARAAKKSVGGNSGPHLPKPNRLARILAKKAAKAAARKSAHAGAAAVRHAADRAALAGRNAYEASTSKLVPIQLSIDVAVPLHVAWEEWRSWGSLPEGVHRIEDVERDGDVLIGHTAGPRRVDWEAEIQDEREDESFAWHSVAGTDVAGLATFHRLSDRLTRIELDLDVVPTKPSQALTMALHLAHRHADADLRRFKAHVEFISPDDYEEQSDQNPKSDRSADGRSNGRQEKPPARKPGKRSASKG
ncbi:MAG: hypothetical protein JO262_03570 [Solirubrobacterales bacterium]|nr:hypothetical protein [Solirubrobacterales bacterium]